MVSIYTIFLKLVVYSIRRTNQFIVNQREYRFLIGEKGQVFVEAFGFLDLFVSTQIGVLRTVFAF